MIAKPTLTEADIRRWIGETSFQRGQSYFRSEAILHPRRQGDTLKAQCQGSQIQPYRIEVTLGPDGPLSGNCSCPVGGGGHCKHAAALLLTWLHHPDTFTAVTDLETSLAHRSKEELIALIRKMLTRYPDLETLLELPTPTAASLKPRLKPEELRRQARRAFQAGRGEWVDAYSVAQDLHTLVELGQGYVEQRNWWDAVTVYDAVIRETLDNYGTMGDEEGSLNEVVNDSVSGLGECLAAAVEPELRETILHTLFDTYRWDVDFGGIDMGYEATTFILRQATPAERQTVAAWVDAALPTGDTWSHDYHRQRYGGFLLQLQADALDDEAFLAVCRQTGRLNDLVERLLRLGRLDEAAAEARQAGDYPLLSLASIFVAGGQGDLVEQIIRERLPVSKDRRLTAWLRDRLLERNDLAEAFPLEEQVFWEMPNTDTYQKLKKLAQALHRWENLRPELLARLTGEKKYVLLTQIHLLENEVEEALAVLAQLDPKTTGWWEHTMAGDLAMQVARAAEAGYPREALDLYLKRITSLIQARGRDNYTTTAGYLLRVRDLYHRLNETRAWEKLIADIYQNNRQLRALKEELAKVGL